jgi:O-antigen/teichoic acid export membrane protein
MDVPAGHGRLSLRKNFIWNFAGNVIYAGCQWGMVVLLAKLTSPEMVGRFALGLAVTAPIILFSQLQLRAVQATDAKDRYDFEHYLALRLVTTGLALLVIAAVVGWGGYGWNTALVILAVGLSKAFESVSDVFYGLMQRHERMDRIARSRILKGSLSLAAMGIVVWISGNVFWGVLAMAVVWGVLLMTYDLCNAQATLLDFRADREGQAAKRNPLWPAFDLRSLLQLAWLALPLGVAGAFLSLITNIPRYFIEKFRGEAELGIFAALAYLIVAGNTLVAAMGQSVVPRLAENYANGDIKRFKRLMLNLLGMGALIGGGGVVVAALAGRQILSLLYRPEYAANNAVFIVLMCAGGLAYMSSFLGCGLTATRRFQIIVVPYVLIAGASLLPCALLIPRYGLMGAALTAVATNLTSLIVLYILLSQILRRTHAKPIAD